MAQLIRNAKDLEKVLLEKSKPALAKAQNRVYEIIRGFLCQFYDEYEEQTEYKRTEQFLNSLVESRIVPDGKGYKAEVYFNLNYVYKDGANPTGEQVMKAAEWGRHGAMGLLVADFKGTSVWHESLWKLDAEAIDILVDMLKAEGIPVVKG